VSARDRIDDLIVVADVDALVRCVDDLVDAGDWDGLLLLRRRCRSAAAETGRQLWPVASLAEYRLALEAPAAVAGPLVCEPDAGRFAVGPLTEVVACRHTWAELAGHLDPVPAAAYVAQERVLRGEDVAALGGGDRFPHDVLELPLVMAPWEPAYDVVTYHRDRIEAPAPDSPAPDSPAPAVLPVPDSVEHVGDPESLDALRDLAQPWVAQSNGRCDAVCVEGTALHALAGLGLRRARLAEVEPAEALRRMAWAAASGGAHGRRRGAAHGRFAAWWAATALVGRLDDWPLPPARLGELVAELRWFVWDAHEPLTGWTLHLAVEDPAEELAWAVAATDAS
jgi:hypothetical protein